MRLEIEGHCDEQGTSEYNLALGERRAGAARDFLVTMGIDASRIDTISYGEEKPEDPGKTEEAWAKNRRANSSSAAGDRPDQRGADLTLWEIEG